MQLYRSLASLGRFDRAAGCVATIGAFDGIHIGHQEILAVLRARAKTTGCPTLVTSFEPLPKEYFSADSPPARLTRFREKFAILDNMGVNMFLCPRFEELRSLEIDEFIDDLLVGRLAVRHVVVGHDFRFAAARRGTMADLESAGKRMGFGVTEVAPVVWRGQRVSSTAVREALASGDMDSAAAMLGRHYAMSGRVVRGAGLGRQLGFPTANVELARWQSPVMGIFAVRVGLRGKTLDGVASVGTRPTVDGTRPLLEVFIFDFNDDIYGEHILVRFIRRLRDEEKFPDLASMTVQMHQDVIDARAALNAA
jgi:riboflavin kinase/FMN adenylyltransferase